MIQGICLGTLAFLGKILAGSRQKVPQPLSSPHRRSGYRIKVVRPPWSRVDVLLHEDGALQPAGEGDSPSPSSSLEVESSSFTNTSSEDWLSCNICILADSSNVVRLVAVIPAEEIA